MNQLCKVCGEPAAGFHFGAFTCEGCKSFFGRTYNNISAIAGCKNNGDCIINKKNRTACKACRLRKCLLVGMSKSGSRYGRRSNWFKIHCLLQEQQSSAGSTSAGGSVGGNGANSNTLEQLARLQQASSQARQTYQDKTNPCIKSAAALSPTLALHAAAAAAVAVAATVSGVATNTTTSAVTTNSDEASSAGGSKTASSALNLPSFFQAAKFLNGQQQQQHLKSFESRLSSNSPSDSGASSAGDPTEDYTSITTRTTSLVNKARQRNCSSVQPGLDVLHDNNASVAAAHERRRKELLEIFRSHSEPLHSPFTLQHHFTLPPTLLACTPHAHIIPRTDLAVNVNVAATAAYKQHQLKTETPSPKELCHISNVDYEEQQQDQPIDLSLKSSSSTANSRHLHTSRTPTPCTSPAESLQNNCHESITTDQSSTNHPFSARKTTPLDLTLVRTQTLTG